MSSGVDSSEVWYEKRQMLSQMVTQFACHTSARTEPRPEIPVTMVGDLSSNSKI
jgi:hypothetical protein